LSLVESERPSFIDAVTEAAVTMPQRSVFARMGTQMRDRDVTRGIRRSWTIVLASLFCATFTSCDGGSSSGSAVIPSCAANARCVADPVAHCVSPTSCVDSSECPAGLSCLPGAIGAGVCASGAQTCSTGTCGIGAAPPVNALLSGFGLEQPLPLEISVVGGYAQVSWTPPGDATAVACALFSCPPEVTARGGPLEIVNFDECALGFGVYPPIGALFDLGNGSAAYRPSSSACADGASSSPVLSIVSVACWSYSSTTLVEASLLTAIPPSEAILASSLVASSCAQTSPQNCVIPDGGIGTCLDGDCRPRCAVDADCDLGATGSQNDTPDAEAGTDAASGARCEALQGFAFGVCVGGHPG
jgi:hypothetical protein